MMWFVRSDSHNSEGKVMIPNVGLQKVLESCCCGVTECNNLYIILHDRRVGMGYFQYNDPKQLRKTLSTRQSWSQHQSPSLHTALPSLQHSLPFPHLTQRIRNCLQKMFSSQARRPPRRSEKSTRNWFWMHRSYSVLSEDHMIRSLRNSKMWESSYENLDADLWVLISWD